MRRVVIICILLLSVLSGNSQLEVSSISFYGETKAKAAFLKSYVSVKEGEKVSLEKLEEDRRNLVTLPLYGHVHLKVDTIESKLDVTFELYEVRTVSPIFDFGGVRGNIYWQLGISNAFSFGNGISYKAFYRSTDNRGNFFLNSRYPFILGSNLGLELELSRESSEEPVFFSGEALNYTYTKNNMSLSTSYSFTPGHVLNLTGAYFTEQYDLNTQNPEGLYPDNVFQKKVLLNAEFNINKLNYYYFKINGWQSFFKLTHVINLNEDNFNLAFYQFKYFKHIKERGNFALRFQTGIATNTNSPFAPFVLDSNVNIRGVGNRQERGTAQTSANIEYRHTVYENKSYAAQVIAYTDMGKWREPGQPIEEVLNLNDWRVFSGFGIRLISLKQYNAIFRVDYGLEPANFIFGQEVLRKGGLTFGLGQYF